MITSDTIGAIAAALAKAQAEMGNAIKDRTNPAFRSSYADLASVREATTAALSSHGIAVVQAPGMDGELVTVETRLIHESGEWLGCVAAARPTKSDPQGIGSTITYLRRYGLMAMAGIAPDDDDGNAASAPIVRPAPQARQEPTKAPPAAEAPPTTRWTAAARKGFCAELGTLSLAYDNVAAYCESLGRPRPSAMTPDARSKLLAHLMTAAGKAAYASFLTTNGDK